MHALIPSWHLSQLANEVFSVSELSCVAVQINQFTVHGRPVPIKIKIGKGGSRELIKPDLSPFGKLFSMELTHCRVSNGGSLYVMLVGHGVAQPYRRIIGQVRLDEIDDRRGMWIFMFHFQQSQKR